jgi:hypothetical protein
LSGLGWNAEAKEKKESSAGKHLRPPLNTADFSYYLLQAQAFKAKAIGLANTERRRLPQSNKPMSSVSRRDA